MIYIKLNEHDEVIYKHFLPFDKENGLKKTKEELEQEGKLVNSIPEMECPVDKVAIEKYNHEMNEVFYEFIDMPKIDTPKNEVDILSEKIKTLEAGLANAEYAMMMGGLI